MDISTITDAISGAPIGLIAGLIGRLIPQGVKYFEDKDQRQHERELLTLKIDLANAEADAQIKLSNATSGNQIKLVDVQGEIDARLAAIKAQGQLTGNKWIDFINQLVRPWYAYAFLLLYFISKWQEYSYGKLIWDESDKIIFGGIIGFWYADRSITKGYLQNVR